MDEQFLKATISIRGVVCGPDECILIIRRASDAGWELPGGRIRRGEAVTACLDREINEETGLSVALSGPVHALSWQNASGDDRFAVYYHCTTEDDAVALSDEHTAAAWLSERVARDRLSDPQAEAVARAVATDAAARPATDE